MPRRRLLLVALAACTAAFAQGPKYGVGRPAAEADIRAVDISIAPDGAGLPPGSGDAKAGAALYERQCRECHGEAGKGSEQAGFVGKPQDLLLPKPRKTVGSYWPYATTLFDYIRRAMPFKTPGSLSDEQVYAVTAYILYLNGLLAEDEKLDAERLKRVEMPNRDGFVPDARPDIQ